MKELVEVAPPGWGHTKAEKEKTKPWKPKSKIGGSSAAFKRALDDGRFKGLPGDKTKKDKVASMFKLMWSMKKKGAKPHYKPGTDEKYKKYQDKDEANEEKQITPMQDNNLFGNAYAGTPPPKKKKQKVKEEVRASYSGGQVTFGQFYNRAKEAMADAKKRKERAARNKAVSDKTREDSRQHGMKFYDSKGSGRLVKGKKVYD